MNLRRWTVLSRTTSDERTAIRKSIDSENKKGWKGFLIGWGITLIIMAVLSIWLSYNVWTVIAIFITSALYTRQNHESRRHDWAEPNISEIDYLRPIPKEVFDE